MGGNQGGGGSERWASVLAEPALVAASLAAFAGSVYITLYGGREIVMNFWTVSLWVAGVGLGLPVVRSPEGVSGYLFRPVALLFGLMCMGLAGLMVLPWIFFVAMDVSKGEFSPATFLALPVFLGLPMLFLVGGDE